MMQYPHKAIANITAKTAIDTDQQSHADCTAISKRSHTQQSKHGAGSQWFLLFSLIKPMLLKLVELLLVRLSLVKLPLVRLSLVKLPKLIKLLGLVGIFSSPAWANDTKKHPDVSHASYTLRIQFSPAVCALQPQRSALRQCKDGYFMTVIGLRPEIAPPPHPPKITGRHQKPPKPHRKCSHQPAKLSPLQTKLVSRIMPDVALRNISWQHYGACTHMSSPQYFRMITKLSSDLSIPPELSTGNDYMVSHQQFLANLLKKNKQLQKQQVQLVCQRYNNSQSFVLTELQVCYDSSGKYHDCQQVLANTCPKQFMIRGLP